MPKLVCRRVDRADLGVDELLHVVWTLRQQMLGHADQSRGGLVRCWGNDCGNKAQLSPSGLIASRQAFATA